jgi:flagellin
VIGFTPLLPSLPRLLAETQRQAALATRRLSTGLRIERASDGAAELALAEQARARLRSTLAARRNALTGIDVLRTADGGLDQIGGLLLRMRELAVQAAQGVLGDTERGFLDQELQQAVREMERIALTTRFDELPLLCGRRSTWASSSTSRRR